MASQDISLTIEDNANPLLVAAVIVHDISDKRVLLIQRGPGAAFAPTLFDLPIGKARTGESVEATAVRELREETGLTVEPEALSLAGAIHGAWGTAAPEGYLALIFRHSQMEG